MVVSKSDLAAAKGAGLGHSECAQGAQKKPQTADSEYENCEQLKNGHGAKGKMQGANNTNNQRN